MQPDLGRVTLTSCLSLYLFVLADPTTANHQEFHPPALSFEPAPQVRMPSQQNKSQANVSRTSRFDSGCDLDEKTNGKISNVVIADQAIYVGGDFTKYAGRDVGRLVKLNFDCEIDSHFTPIGHGFNGSVHSLAVSEGSLYVGGGFTSYRGVPNNAQRLAKLDLSSGSLDTTFTQKSSGFNGTVTGLHVIGSSLYVLGSFNSYRGGAANARRAAKLDLKTGSLDVTLLNQVENNLESMTFVEETGHIDAAWRFKEPLIFELDRDPSTLAGQVLLNLELDRICWSLGFPSTRERGSWTKISSTFQKNERKFVFSLSGIQCEQGLQNNENQNTQSIRGPIRTGFNGPILTDSHKRSVQSGRP